jgi:hypothetical protein
MGTTGYLIAAAMPPSPRAWQPAPPQELDLLTRPAVSLPNPGLLPNCRLYLPYSNTVSKSAITCSGGTSAWILCPAANTKPPPGTKASSNLLVSSRT